MLSDLKVRSTHGLEAVCNVSQTVMRTVILYKSQYSMLTNTHSSFNAVSYFRNVVG